MSVCVYVCVCVLVVMLGFWLILARNIHRSLAYLLSHPSPKALRLGKRTVVYLYWVPAQYISAIKV